MCAGGCCLSDVVPAGLTEVGVTFEAIADGATVGDGLVAALWAVAGAGLTGAGCEPVVLGEVVDAVEGGDDDVERVDDMLEMVNGEKGELMMMVS